jgi:hypothetical protein
MSRVAHSIFWRELAHSALLAGQGFVMAGGIRMRGAHQFHMQIRRNLRSAMSVTVMTMLCPLRGRGPWRSFEAVEFATLECVDWFNHRRLPEPIGNIPPAGAEENYYAMLDEIPMAAQLKPNSLRQSRGGSLAFKSDCIKDHHASHLCYDPAAAIHFSACGWA